MGWRERERESVCVFASVHNLYSNSSQDFKLYITVDDCVMCVCENSIIISILNLCCSQRAKEKRKKNKIYEPMFLFLHNDEHK